MKKIYLSLLIGLIAGCVYAQSEMETYKKEFSQLVVYYNSNQYDSIFNQFSPEMKEAMPIDKTRTYFTGMYQQAGQIVGAEFIRYDANTPSIAIYKTQFNHGVFAVNVSLDSQSKINGFSIGAFVDESLPLIERNTTKLILPFNDEWFVVWGGDTEELNYHVVAKSQKNAFDFVILDKLEQTHKNSGENNEDYYCFGKDLIAPCDAEVVLAVDGIKDNKPGEMNSIFPLGNTVVLKTANNEYLYFCHFKQFSIAVKQGQKIKQGELLGFCGNSGHSSEAHLHFHIQNIENMEIATGIKCYFESIFVNEKLETDYSPIRNEVVKNQ